MGLLWLLAFTRSARRFPGLVGVRRPGPAHLALIPFLVGALVAGVFPAGLLTAPTLEQIPPAASALPASTGEAEAVILPDTRSISASSDQIRLTARGASEPPGMTAAAPAPTQLAAAAQVGAPVPGTAAPPAAVVPPPAPPTESSERTAPPRQPAPPQADARITSGANRSSGRVRATEGDGRVIVLDPGHGGREVGAQRAGPFGMIQEKNLTLQTALKAAQYLREDGWKVVLTRETDTTVNFGRDVNGDGAVTVVDDLQARIDVANSNKAAVFVSIHYNAAENQQGGTETFFNPERPYAAESQQLAGKIQGELLKALASVGYTSRNRGVIPDTKLLKGFPFYLLGDRKYIARASLMPAALGEGLFLTNDAEFEAIQRPETIDAIALAYSRAIEHYLTD